MNMKDMIQQMTDLENSAKQELTESRRIAECPPEQAVSSPMAIPATEGTPVSVNVNMTASGKEHVEDLLSMMKAAGLDNAEPMKPNMMPMRNDMERLRGIVDDPEIPGKDDVPGDQDVNNGAFLAPMAGAALGTMAANKITGEEEIEEYDNEPDEEYRDHEYMTHDLSGGINRRKKSYSDAEDGDNAMAVEGWKAPDEGEYFDDEEGIEVRWQAGDDGDIDIEAYDKDENMVILNPDQEEHYKDLIMQDLQDQHDEYGDYKMRLARDESMQETIKNKLYAALAEKKEKPDFLDADKDGDTKEPMKKAAKDKKKKVPTQFQKKKTNEAELKDFKPKAVPGLYNFDHFEAPDGSFIQISPHGYGVYQDSDGNRHDFNSMDQLKQIVKKEATGAKTKKKSKVDEARPARTQQNLMYMELGAINSGKGKKYFLMDYEMPHGIHNPQAFQKQIKENPIVQKLKDDGYVGPRQIAGWKGDIESAISQAEETADHYKDSADDQPAQHYDSKRRLENLQTAKKIIDSGNLVS